jgi:fumarate hydratase class II
MGHDVAIGIGASQGQFELNVYKPLMALNVLDSIRLLADAMQSFGQHCVQGLQANTEQLQRHLQRSLMLVTALSPHIGYERAAQIAKRAQISDLSLRQAALALGYVTAEEFDTWVDPHAMLGH